MDYTFEHTTVREAKVEIQLLFDPSKYEGGSFSLETCLEDPTILARDNTNTVIGCLIHDPHYLPESLNNRFTVPNPVVHVAEKWRRRGVGRSLVLKILEEVPALSGLFDYDEKWDKEVEEWNSSYDERVRSDEYDEESDKKLERAVEKIRTIPFLKSLGATILKYDGHWRWTVLSPSAEFVRMTNSLECHYGFQYQDGLNVLSESFSLGHHGGGMYFIPKNKISNWEDGSTEIDGELVWLREVSLPPDAIVTQEALNVFKADKIILGKRTSLH